MCNFFRYLADKIRAAMFSEYAASYARVTGQDVILIPRGGEEFRAGGAIFRILIFLIFLI
jgi:hypothetical protein